MSPTVFFLPFGLFALGCGLAAEHYYRVATRRAAEAKADREATERIRKATAEHVREVVTRKPFDVAERLPPPRYGLLLDERGVAVQFPIPNGSHPIFGRVPRGVA